MNLHHVLHCGDERRILCRRNDKIFAQVRLEFVFFSVRAMVLKCAAGTIWPSTTCAEAAGSSNERTPGHRRTGEHNQPGFGLVIEHARNRRRFALLARQCQRLDPLLDKNLTHSRDHVDVGVERCADPFVLPSLATLGLISFEQDAACRKEFAGARPFDVSLVSRARSETSSLTMNFLFTMASHLAC